MTQIAASGNSLSQDAQQVAARKAIMTIPLFPDLVIRLRHATGYGPHVEMLQHFCYWFSLRHPKMQNRWDLYKTYAEWREECGLARKQVDKGRRTLRRLGLVIEKQGPHGRIHCCVNWVAVTDILSLSPVGEQGQVVPQGEQGSLSPVGEHANTGDYVGKYEQETSLLQSGAEPAKTEPAPPPIDEELIEIDDLKPRDTDRRHSQEAPTRSETAAPLGEIARRMGVSYGARETEQRELSKDTKNKVFALMFPQDGESDLTKLVDDHLDDKHVTLRDVARRVREQSGSSEALELFTPFVEGCIEERRQERVDLAS